jgi:hypothetical protein
MDGFEVCLPLIGGHRLEITIFTKMPIWPAQFALALALVVYISVHT